MLADDGVIPIFDEATTQVKLVAMRMKGVTERECLAFIDFKGTISAREYQASTLYPQTNYLKYTQVRNGVVTTCIVS